MTSKSKNTSQSTTQKNAISETESEYVVKKKEIKDLCDRSNIVINQYRKDIIETKGEYKLLREKYEKLEKFAEKQAEELKKYYNNSQRLEKEVNVIKSKKIGGFNIDNVNIKETEKLMEKEIEEYCNKHRQTDDFICSLQEKYGLNL